MHLVEIAIELPEFRVFIDLLSGHGWNVARTVVVSCCAFGAAASFAQGEPPTSTMDDLLRGMLAPPAKEIKKQVIKSATAYANAISCERGEIGPRNVIPLVPFTNQADRDDAKYAVLWNGDIGCAGGSGTSGTRISIVRVSTGGTYVVDPMQSEPAVEFESRVRFVDRIVSFTPDSLTLEGKTFGPNDANCCPSVNIRFTLRADEKGNWRLVTNKPPASMKQNKDRPD